MDKPIPNPSDELNAEFWNHCFKEKLCFQRCIPCGKWRHVPRYMCASCGSADWEWAESSGRGRLFSWIVTHRSLFPAFADDVPYTVAIVEMEEGVRMVGGLRGCEPDELRLDQPLEVSFERVSDTAALPYFRPTA